MMTTIENLYRTMGKCPCCEGPPELRVEPGIPREVLIRCRVCGVATRKRRAASVVRPMKGMEGAPMPARFDASERRQTISLAFRAIADWNRRPPGVKLALAIPVGQTTHLTRECVPVAVGQVWRSHDRRSPVRHVKVLALGAQRFGRDRATVRVTRCGPDGRLPVPVGPTSTLSTDRMHWHAKGWTLVR